MYRVSKENLYVEFVFIIFGRVILRGDFEEVFKIICKISIYRLKKDLNIF